MTIPPPDSDRPQFRQIDAYGLTHTGRVRSENQDHFFLGALARGVAVEYTSLDVSGTGMDFAQRMASLAIVADGVGGSADGGRAARMAVRGLVEAVSRSYHDANRVESKDPEVFTRLLHDAALSCHSSLVEEAGGGPRFATTLTLFLGQWPHAYFLQVGDSRGYLYANGELRQITQDQTYAEELVARGLLTRTQAERSRWSNVLSSAVGGESAIPVVTRIERDWGTVVLLCSDGLTKHVSNEQIAHRLEHMTSSKDACEQLLQDALDGGGSDNITIVIGRTVATDEAPA
jgi:protein phosphatase